MIARNKPDFVPAPAGAHPAICCDVVDLGILEVSYNGKTNKQHKIKIVWQLDEDRDDGSPFRVQKRYTLSLHEKSNLRKDLAAWRGRDFSAEELEGFELDTLIAVPALLNVIHAPGRDGQTWANIASLMRLPKQMSAPKIRDYVREIERKPAEGEAVGAAPQHADDDWQPTDDDVPF